ncbi:hypothetical protein H920_11909 [Fukomys damarensis]|uniref:Uncharacterized protein n=1 Tax=Fukomys damarensis TaxID=885580 RepID=A0A091D8D0_FUKDA|nr:hypothetical protein H920_11909 [Fukomys damarensis]
MCYTDLRITKLKTLVTHIHIATTNTSAIVIKELWGDKSILHWKKELGGKAADTCKGNEEFKEKKSGTGIETEDVIPLTRTWTHIIVEMMLGKYHSVENTDTGTHQAHSKVIS